MGGRFPSLLMNSKKFQFADHWTGEMRFRLPYCTTLEFELVFWNSRQWFFRSEENKWQAFKKYLLMMIQSPFSPGKVWLINPTIVLNAFLMMQVFFLMLHVCESMHDESWFKVVFCTIWPDNLFFLWRIERGSAGKQLNKKSPTTTPFTQSINSMNRGVTLPLLPILTKNRIYFPPDLI